MMLKTFVYYGINILKSFGSIIGAPQPPKCIHIHFLVPVHADFENVPNFCPSY